MVMMRRTMVIAKNDNNKIKSEMNGLNGMTLYNTKYSWYCTMLTTKRWLPKYCENGK